MLRLMPLRCGFGALAAQVYDPLMRSPDFPLCDLRYEFWMSKTFLSRIVGENVFPRFYCIWRTRRGAAATPVLGSPL